MDINLTAIVALIDKSGSMKPLQKDTVGGFNAFLEEQRKVPGRATMSLAMFNDHYESVYMDVPLEHVAPLTEETYKPGGNTALNDSLGRLINEFGTKLASKPESERPGKVVVLIMSDGEENCSKEFKLDKIREMVKHQQDVYKWSVIFLGANLDSFKVGANYGIDRRSTINYKASSIGQQNAYKSVSRGVAESRLSAQAGLQFCSFFTNEANQEVISDAKLDTSDLSEVLNKYTPVPVTKSDADTTTKS